VNTVASARRGNRDIGSGLSGDVARTLGNRSGARNARAAGLAVAGGLLHGAAFPSSGAWPLAFVALTPLLIALRGRSVRAGAALGWCEGTVAAGVCVVPWLAASAREFFGLGPLAALGVGVAAGQIFGAAPIALFGAAAARLGRLRSAPERVLAIAAAWVASELARARLLTGNPWDLLGYAVAGVPALVQIADLGGVALVSFVLAATAAALAEAVTAPRPDARRALALAALVVGAHLAYGLVRLATWTDGGERVAVALVQGNVPNAWRNDPTHVGDAVRTYADLTRGALAARPDLVVWPENAVSVLLAPNTAVRTTIASVLEPAGVPLALGAPRAAAGADGRVEHFNSAHLLAPDGAELGVYDKRHLVPFAEYRPLRRVAGLELAPARPGDYTPGDTRGLFSWPTPFGVLVCFEVIYPELARDVVGAGARFLVNLSNDAWFAGAAAREQHFAAVVLRAVELRRPIVRVANAGITAAVDAAGRVVARFPIDVAGAWTVSIAPSDATTLYARTGDLFAWLATAGVLLGLVRARRRGA
jgi:apolipoprotein N-acyltransferase